MTTLIAPTRDQAGIWRTPGSYADYLALPDIARIIEWKDGEIIEHMPPLDKHQSIAGFLYSLLGLFIRLLDLGEIRLAPLEVKLWPDGPSREPDVFVVTKPHLAQLTAERFLGGPDLVIEVVSTSSTRIDRVEKFMEYERAGVREYWLVDPRRGKQQADFYQSGEDKRFVSIPLDDMGLYHSLVLPGFRLDPRWLRAATLPDPQVLLAEIAKDLEALPADVRAAYTALYLALKK